MTEEKENLKEATPEVKAEEPAALKDSLCVAEETPHQPAELTASSQGEATEREDDEAALLRAELESVRGQVTRLEHERYLLSRGVPEEDLDYYAFKIEHMEGAKSDFAKAAKEYLKAHPVRRTAVSSGADLTAGSTRRPATSSELMNQLLRNH